VREAAFLLQLPQRGIDGAIVVPTSPGAAQIRNNIAANFPMVILQRQIEGLGPTVAPDRQQAAELLCQTLDKVGVRRIALITGPHSLCDQRVYAQAGISHMKLGRRTSSAIFR
jgi:DNA-binding LacI/PurR family transcriptional regulator